MRTLSFVLALLGGPALAHEFWIEPGDYTIGVQTMIQGDLVNGQDFQGGRQPYLTQRFVRFQMFSDGRLAPVGGRNGDNPAVNVAPLGEGLHVLSYQSTPATLDYESWEKFQNFIDHKGFGDVRTRHDARGLPDSGFVEVYTRYSKSLVGVGSAGGSDVRTGLETEIVAMTNPYTDSLSSGMQFQLFYGNAPRANARFEVFEKAPNGAVNVTFYQTDGNGRVAVPVKSGHSYMADAVVLREPSAALAANTGAVWETLWANITWAVP
ncbi:Uncharacterized conserved protein, contains GH25 family domain [Cognatiyoonia koreensis]|uniref:Uncharacterized conserved protein, contains GH25 family domain n=1 Tax=Cognatiyoonia koreensis TaxID=364200 RepID=A0A1I0P6Z4_9RHOB|nr:DUF4198 domain-containing protein [Cognatiyoonia koreensis]SEW09840.1 Uncharacterized conserved protein, contains GH25 family domain [Cognatiyoonia koreensis]